MIHIRVLFISLLVCSNALADIVSPTRTIRANTIITEADVATMAGSNPNAFTNVHDVIGQEAKTTLYAGRAVYYDDVGPPALVTRNQIVPIEFRSGGLVIVTEGRSLERGGVGDHVRVMNLTSRATFFGQVQNDGSIKVRN